MSRHQELSRFSGNGKTFFFNKGEAKNGTEYLAVNALYGKGNQERIVLFPPHFLEFIKHLKNSIESLTGFEVVPPKELQEAEPENPCLNTCPNCGWDLEGAEEWL